MRTFTHEEKEKIYKELKNLCEDVEILNKKFSLLLSDRINRFKDNRKNYRGYTAYHFEKLLKNKDFKIFAKKPTGIKYLEARDYFYNNKDNYFDDIINDVYSKITFIQNYLKDELTQEVLFVCLDAIIEADYFNDVVEDKTHYDPQQIEDNFKKVERFLQSTGKIEINIPKKPQDIFSDTFEKLTEVYNTNKKDTKDLLKYLLNDVNNYELTQSTKKKRKKEWDKYVDTMKDFFLDNPDITMTDEERKELIKKLKI